MIPDYLSIMLSLAAFAYVVDSLIESYMVIKGYQEAKKNQDKNQGLGVLFQ